ncbi:hypothetical protein H4R26_001259 [Coemansia thaxteri]|uniref:Uncharacterized protein n=1 Tax=Coemansia thaxteri TaxID=2663907 RepID=A0A9W8BL35_9FUNG|nr:hypothetical protein H4R26_001259 [Coemansia thaxteri]KAJ2480958.1 hypothetical protein EV174_003598 [Coemansia sp. RSA 2320]
MRISRVATVLLFAGSAMAWTLPQKIGIYSLIQKLAQQKTGSIEEHIIYGKLAVFLGDMPTAAKLSNALESPQFRDALFSLLSNVNTVRSEAISDPDGVGNIDYLVDRIRKTYAESIKVFFSRWQR